MDETGTEITLAAPLVGAIVWLFVTLIFKAIGQRVEPSKIKLSQSIWDFVLDFLTLLFAWQVALSLGQANIVQLIARELRGGAEEMADATGWGILTSLVIGIFFFILAVVQGRKFAAEDELKEAWRPLSLFTIFMLVAGSLVPYAEDWATSVSTKIAVPVGSAIAAGVNYVLAIPH